MLHHGLGSGLSAAPLSAELHGKERPQTLLNTMEQSLILASVLEFVTAGTGQWLLEDDQVVAWKDGREVQHWMMPSGTTINTVKKLWLYGEAGSGRTCNAAIMVDRLMKDKKAQVGVCYYFCNTFIADVDAADILKTLVKQVAQLHADAETQYEASVQHGSMPECNWTDTQQFDERDALHWGMLLVSLSKKFEALYMVVDHLDMLPPEPLQLIASLVDVQGSTLRSMFTTGDGPSQQRLCMETISCPLRTQAPDREVQMYIRRQLDIREVQSKEDQELIEKLVLRRAGGHWASAAADFENRFDLLRRGLSIDEDTGLSLFDIFDNQLLRAMRDNAVSKFILLRAVRLLCAAKQYPDITLTVPEMCQVLTALLQEHGLLDTTSLVKKSEIIDVCCCLLRESTTLDSFQYASRAAHNYVVEHLKAYSQPLKQLYFERKTYKTVFDELGVAGDLLAKPQPIVAESVLNKKYTAYSNSFGVSDIYTLNTLRTLADLYATNERFDEAESAYKFVMKSDDETAVLDATNALAVLYKQNEMFAEAETHYRMAIDGHQQRNEQQTADKVSGNLALMYAAKGEHTLARQIWGRLLETSPLPDNPMMGYNYALSFTQQSMYEEATPLLERSLEEYELFYGDRARETADVAKTLAEVYANQRRLAEAEMLFKRVVAIHDANSDLILQLGTKHSLAKVYLEQNRLDVAKTLLEQILSAFEDGEGWILPAAKAGLTLYFLLDETDQLEDAAKLGERVVTGFETHLGNKDDLTISTTDHMGFTYARLGRLEDAERMWNQAFEGYKATTGEDDRLTCAAAHNLGLSYTKLNRYEDARQMLKFALSGYRQDEGMRVRLLNDLDALKKAENVAKSR